FAASTAVVSFEATAVGFSRAPRRAKPAVLGYGPDMNDRRRGDRGVETEPPRSAGARFRESAAVVIVRGHGDSLEVFWGTRSDAGVCRALAAPALRLGPLRHVVLPVAGSRRPGSDHPAGRAGLGRVDRSRPRARTMETGAGDVRGPDPPHPRGADPGRARARR